jgi:hypothetical protein
MSHSQSVTDRDSRKGNGCAAGSQDACLYSFGDLIEMYVTGDDFVVGVYDADQRTV